MKTALFIALGIFSVAYIAVWLAAILRKRRKGSTPDWRDGAIGFITNFFDTLGIGSFAPTTSFFKLWKLVPDEQIPGTLNVGHTIPTLVEAFIYIAVVNVDLKTLILMIGASVAGSFIDLGLPFFIFAGLACAGPESVRAARRAPSVPSVAATAA